MKNKLIILDLDQTLIDLVEFHDAAFSRAFFDVFGVKTTFKKISFTGKTYHQITEELCKLENIDKETAEKGIVKVIQNFKQYFPEILKEKKTVTPLPGAKELLKALKNYNLVLTTASPSEAVQPVLEKAKLTYFPTILTGDNANTKVELVKLAKKIADPKNKLETFIIGDSIEDIKAAKIIGAKTIGITTGIHSEKELKEAGADHVFPNLLCEEILKIIGE
ncbi:HAD family hydrolase [Candidatus Woesearchaeota archaeon]|nr:HAD family hydrolase [Candidatus Woesearchaeota archaeon]